MHVPSGPKYYMKIRYMMRGDMRKRKCLNRSVGIEVLWEMLLGGKSISGSDVRKLIAEGKAWEKYVSRYVYDCATENHMDERLRK